MKYTAIYQFNSDGECVCTVDDIDPPLIVIAETVEEAQRIVEKEFEKLNLDLTKVSLVHRVL